MTDMTYKIETRYYANKDYVLREVVGEFLLIPTGRLVMTSNKTLTISESAAFLFDNMSKGKTEQDLCDLLCREYEVEEADEEMVRSDVRMMLESMLGNNTIYAVSMLSAGCAD